MNGDKFGRAAALAAGLLGVGSLVGPGAAHADGFPNLEGRWGVGFSASSVLSLGLAPTAEYWFKNNLATAASVNIIGDFTSYGVRGIYLLDNEIRLFGQPAKPYVALGFASITEDFSGGDLEGSGLEFYGGLQQFGVFGNRDLAWGAEFGYSTVKTEAFVDYCSLVGLGPRDPRCSGTIEGDYGGFFFGGKLMYYFGR